MKPFDLEASKAGKPICTRDGTTVPSVAYVPDARPRHQVLVLLGDEAYRYPPDGRYFVEHGESGFDLIIASVRRIVWVNVYRGPDGFYVGSKAYDTKEQAVAGKINNSRYHATVSFEVEE